MRWVRTIVWMVLFVLAVVFSMQNRQEVTLTFGISPLLEKELFLAENIPLFIPILFAFLLGLLIGGVSDILRRFKLRRQVRQGQKTVERLEREVDTLRRSSLSAPFRETTPPEDDKP